MSVATYVIGTILIVLGVLLVAAVLLQSGKEKSLSGSISGMAESFLGKERGSRLDKLLDRFTLVGSIVFGVLAVVLYAIQ